MNKYELITYLNKLAEFCHTEAVNNGFGASEQNLTTSLLLVHSEISEATEAYRRGLMDDKLPDRPGLEVELADAVIRILDVCHAMKLDIGGAFYSKMEYNRTRPDFKSEARNSKNGKKF